MTKIVNEDKFPKIYMKITNIFKRDSAKKKNEILHFNLAHYENLNQFILFFELEENRKIHIYFNEKEFLNFFKKVWNFYVKTC